MQYGINKQIISKPPDRNQNRCFFSEKEKKRQNVLEGKICKNTVCDDIFVRVSVKHFDIFPDIFIKY